MSPRRLTFSHIEAFRAVMAAGSMTKASYRLHTSQPQVSRLIAQLEVITGLPLFDRSGGHLSPTLDGTRFHAKVEEAFVALASLERAASSIRAFGAERLRVAAMPRLAGGLLARAVARFKAEHPEVVVAIQSGTEDAIADWIATGFCDAALTMMYGNAGASSSDYVASLDCVAVLPHDHTLTVQETLGPEDFRGEAFIAPALGTALRAQMDAVFAAVGVELTVTAEATLGASVCALVAAGVGISIVNPLAAFEEAKISAIVIRPFLPALSVQFALLFPFQQTRSRLVQTFADCARATFSDELGLLSEGLADGASRNVSLSRNQS